MIGEDLHGRLRVGVVSWLHVKIEQNHTFKHASPECEQSKRTMHKSQNSTSNNFKAVGKGTLRILICEGSTPVGFFA
jgi:hypothetical protein